MQLAPPVVYRQSFYAITPTSLQSGYTIVLAPKISDFTTYVSSRYSEYKITYVKVTFEPQLTKAQAFNPSTSSTGSGSVDNSFFPPWVYKGYINNAADVPGTTSSAANSTLSWIQSPYKKFTMKGRPSIVGVVSDFNNVAVNYNSTIKPQWLNAAQTSTLEHLLGYVHIPPQLNTNTQRQIWQINLRCWVRFRGYKEVPTNNN